jgi:hypothetical protein
LRSSEKRFQVILAKDRETEQRRAVKVIWGETWFLTHQELKKTG